MASGSIRFMVILLFFLPYLLKATGEIKNISFNTISIKEGLSQSSVTAILQDEAGFMWFGTLDGLNKYNGYEFIHYRNKHGDSTSLPSNAIKTLFEDSKNRIWIGLQNGGLSCYNKATGNFKNYPLPKADNNIHNQLVTAISEDDKGYLWVGSQNGLIYKLNPESKKYKRSNIINELTRNKDHLNALVNDIVNGPNGYLWVASNNTGIIAFNPSDGKLIDHFSPKTNGSKKLPEDDITELNFMSDSVLFAASEDGMYQIKLKNESNGIRSYFKPPQSSGRTDVNSIYIQSSRHIWVATLNRGLIHLNTKTENFTSYKNKPGKSTSISSNAINKIYKDKSGIFWLGTKGKGLNWFSLDKKFKYYANIPTEKNGYLNKSTRAILEDNQGNFWIGSYSGLDKYNPETDQVTSLPFIKDSKKHYNKNIYSLYEDRKKRLWVGSEGGGLYRYKQRTNNFINYDRNQEAHSKTTKFVFDIQEGPKGFLWLASGFGLNRFNPETGNFKLFLDQLSNRASRNIRYLMKDEWDRIWIATKDGYIIFDPITHQYTKYNNLTGDSTGLLNLKINSFIQTNKHTVWMGTSGGGVSKIHLDSQNNPDHYKHYTEDQGLPNNVVYGILQDKQGHLWLSTNNGLARLDPQSETFTNYKAGDGLQSNEFNSGAFYKASDGELFFGGINGLNSFYPSQIHKNDYVPPIVLTGFKKMGESVDLEKPIAQIESIDIPFKSNVFTLQFAALDYQDPSKNQYAYKLKGFNDDWVHLGNRRHISFTNLDPGSYTLRIKASNNDGVWNEEGISIEVNIVPPFWQTNWFYVSVFGSIIGLIGFIYFWRLQSVKKQKLVLEKEVSKRTEDLKQMNEELEKTKDEAEEATKAKSNFLASMSHEIRTPMNAVIGMSDLLMDTRPTKEQKDYIQTIQKSGQNLLEILNDILDISKIESGKMMLENRPFNLRFVIEDVFEIFAPKAADKQLDIGYWMETNVPESIIGDETRLKQILTNLLSNALKFTEKGEVFLEVKLNENRQLNPNQNCQLYFALQDTGLGIEEKNFDKLFQNFSQIDASTTRKYGGTGLGLAICKNLVEQMGGKIDFVSEYQKGTKFYFTINTITAPASFDQELHIADFNTHLRALVLSNNTISTYAIKNYLYKASISVNEKTISSNSDLPGIEECLKYHFIFWDETAIKEELSDLIGQYHKQSKGKNYWVKLSYNPSMANNQTDGSDDVIKKPIKPNNLWRTIENYLYEGTHKEQTIETEPNYDSTMAQSQPMNILLVEDNEMNQKVAMKHLTKLGYEPELSKNGREALDKVIQGNFDLVLMDVQMPEMDGIEATKHIKAKMEPDQIPFIIAMTANAMKSDCERYLQEGMDDYLVKPITIQNLVEKLNGWYKVKN